ncbi:hypothetical protein GALMADRAFT_148467 [Galerina marginata CBS 339.88]|uniref:Uncharacterized protein n=1 Tax=Galerina marginata (strain CBS 339.88) TaxID=685588 RepID=A0A067S4D1_GALM3|nr:hypothetical protein GALMADRAFT_148467 [Galerina marginata CBS 339.88]
MASTDDILGDRKTEVSPTVGLKGSLDDPFAVAIYRVPVPEEEPDKGLKRQPDSGCLVGTEHFKRRRVNEALKAEPVFYGVSNVIEAGASTFILSLPLDVIAAISGRLTNTNPRSKARNNLLIPEPDPNPSASSESFQRCPLCARPLLGGTDHQTAESRGSDGPHRYATTT